MTMKFDLAGFAAHCLTMEADIRLAEEAAMEKACQMVEKAAKRAIGKYLPGMIGHSLLRRRRRSAAVSASMRTSRCCEPASCAIRSRTRSATRARS